MSRAISPTHSSFLLLSNPVYFIFFVSFVVIQPSKFPKQNPQMNPNDLVQGFKKIKQEIFHSA